VHVLADRPEARVAVACTYADDRELPLEGDELLGQLVVGERFVPIDPPLALAVVAQAARLDECRQPRLVEAAEPRRRDPERPEELLSRRRSWPSSRARGPGTAPMRAAASTGTFSNS
jgi:hypothetical protein